MIAKGDFALKVTAMKTYMAKHNLKGYQLAKKLGVSGGTVSRWMAVERVQKKYQRPLCRALRCHHKTLFKAARKSMANKFLTNELPPLDCVQFPRPKKRRGNQMELFI